jgi:hypothetical protein
MREDAAGLDRHREIDRVDCADAVHAAEGEDDVVPVLRRYAAADKAGIAALRHYRQLCLGADPHHRRDLRGRSWAHDEPGRTAVEAPRLEQIGFLLAGIGNPSSRANRRLDLLDRRLEFHDPLLDSAGGGHVRGIAHHSKASSLLSLRAGRRRGVGGR